MMQSRFRLTDSDKPADIAEYLASLGDVRHDPAKSKKIVFFDTFDWRLFSEGKSISIQTGKSGPEVHVVDHHKNEPIAVIPGHLPSGYADDLPPGHIRDIIIDIIDVRRLLPCLEITSRQTAFTFRNKDGKITLRMTMDKLRARNPNNGRPVPLGIYMSVEPVRGYVKAEKKACRLLSSKFEALPPTVPLQLEGLRAIGVEPGKYSSKLRLNLSPSMTAAGAARHIHLELLDTIELNEDGSANNTDPEFLHDFRVAVRRTRSALSQLDKDVLPARIVAKAKADFRWIGQQTNLMRDLDVYLIDYPEFERRLPIPFKPSLQAFRDFLATQSRQETKNVARMIRGARYRKIRDNWRAYLTTGYDSDKQAPLADTPVMVLADARIWKVYCRVMKEGGAIDDASPPSALHDLRITCKKLRYLLEFFQSLYPLDDITALIKSLKTFQNVLGEFQDTEVQSQAILNYGRQMAAAHAAPVETQMAMGMVAETILQRQDIARSEFNERFREFSRADVKASYQTLFRNQG
jgi:CHAD domain-containing protein